jgi:hypothetical protein
MTEGFVLDRGDHDARRQATWIGGKPEPSFWTGLKLKDRPQLKIATFRCPKCGLLESYAREDVEWSRSA